MLQNYRELDRGTCYFRSQILDLWSSSSRPDMIQSAWIEKVLWASVCYRVVNKIETFEVSFQPRSARITCTCECTSHACLCKTIIQALGGIPTREEWTIFQSKFRKLPPPVFTSAHLNPGVNRYLEAMQFLKTNVSSKAVKLFEASQARDLEKCFNIIREIPHVGNFFAWQVTCDLLESKCLAPCTDNDWTMLGPGAKSRFLWIFCCHCDMHFISHDYLFVFSRGYRHYI